MDPSKPEESQSKIDKILSSPRLERNKELDEFFLERKRKKQIDDSVKTVADKVHEETEKRYIKGDYTEIAKLFIEEQESSRIADFTNWFYDSINKTVKMIYNQSFGKEEKVPKEEALKNLDEFAKFLLTLGNVRFTFWKLDESAGKKRPSEIADLLEKDDLEYIELSRLDGIRKSRLFKIAQSYDSKGIIPLPDENLNEFVYRGNTFLFLHKVFRETRSEPKLDIKSDSEYKLDTRLENVIPKKDIIEANKRIPYEMDLSWVAGFAEDLEGHYSPLLSMAFGICFTLPKYRGLNFLVLRDRFKNRDKYLDVLAHEMAHMGTVAFDPKRDFLETKAYAAGTAAFGEYTIAINQRQHIIEKAIKFIVQIYTRIELPDYLFRIIPKVRSAIRIAGNKKTFNGARERLQTLYGKSGGNYVLGRLNGEEIEEFYFTNNIPARVEMKDNLKWRIIKEKLREQYSST